MDNKKQNFPVTAHSGITRKPFFSVPNQTIDPRYIKMVGDVQIEANHDDFSESNVNHPSHYNQGSVEVIDMMIRIWGVEKVKVFCELNAFKYRMRAGYKGISDEDLNKALWYENKMKELN